LDADFDHPRPRAFENYFELDAACAAARVHDARSQRQWRFAQQQLLDGYGDLRAIQAPRATDLYRDRQRLVGDRCPGSLYRTQAGVTRIVLYQRDRVNGDLQAPHRLLQTLAVAQLAGSGQASIADYHQRARPFTWSPRKSTDRAH